MSKLWYQLEREYNQKLMDKENVLLALTIYIFDIPLVRLLPSLLFSICSSRRVCLQATNTLEKCLIILESISTART